MEPTLLDDRILVERAREGNRDAFGALIERHKKKIYAVALDMTGDHHDAEDISQDVSLKAFRSLRRFRGSASVSTWLYRMTVNTCIDRSRKQAIFWLSQTGDPRAVMSPSTAIASGISFRSASVTQSNTTCWAELDSSGRWLSASTAMEILDMFLVALGLSRRDGRIA